MRKQLFILSTADEVIRQIIENMPDFLSLPISTIRAYIVGKEEHLQTLVQQEKSLQRMILQAASASSGYEDILSKALQLLTRLQDILGRRRKDNGPNFTDGRKEQLLWTKQVHLQASI